MGAGTVVKMQQLHDREKAAYDEMFACAAAAAAAAGAVIP
jgi:hypothetical protein